MTPFKRARFCHALPSEWSLSISETACTRHGTERCAGSAELLRYAGHLHCGSQGSQLFRAVVRDEFKKCSRLVGNMPCPALTARPAPNTTSEGQCDPDSGQLRECTKRGRCFTQQAPSGTSASTRRFTPFSWIERVAKTAYRGTAKRWAERRTTCRWLLQRRVSALVY